eukprot:tig00000459_g1128.t1
MKDLERTRLQSLYEPSINVRPDVSVNCTCSDEDAAAGEDAEVEGFEADEELDAELYGLTGGAGAEFGAEAPAPELQA